MTVTMRRPDYRLLANDRRRLPALPEVRAGVFLDRVAHLLPPADATLWLAKAQPVLMVTAGGGIPRRGDRAALALPDARTVSLGPAWRVRARVVWVGKWNDYTSGVAAGLVKVDAVNARWFYVDATAKPANVEKWQVGTVIIGVQQQLFNETVTVWATAQEWAVLGFE